MTVVIAPTIDRYPNYQALKGIAVKPGVYLPALTDHFREATRMRLRSSSPKMCPVTASINMPATM